MRLSKASISDAALSILDAYGLADVTMRRVAASLDVAAGALYWHVANKQELIAEMAARIVAPALESPLPARDLALALRRAVLTHRDGAEVVLSAVAQTDSSVREDLLGALRGSLGEDGEAQRAAASGLLYLTLGSAAVQQAGSQLAEATGTAASDDRAADAEALRAVDLLLAGLEYDQNP